MSGLFCATAPLAPLSQRGLKSPYVIQIACRKSRVFLYMLKSYDMMKQTDKLGFVHALLCPLSRGLSAKLTGGCTDKQFFRKTVQLLICSNPQPPVEGARENIGSILHIRTR